MSDAGFNIVTKPHMRHEQRFLTNEIRQRADRVNKAETNYKGVAIPKKTVIKLHEDFRESLPSAETMKTAILDFHRQHGHKPSILTMTKSCRTKRWSFYCPEISEPGEWPMVCLTLQQGEFTELR